MSGMEDASPPTAPQPHEPPRPEPAEPPAAARVYAVQRRFDMATLFVMTTLFAVVFALVRSLGGSLTTAVMIAGCIVVVGLVQAVAGPDRSPRWVSILAGGGYWAACGVIVGRLEDGLGAGVAFGVLWGLFGAPVGYLAGAIAAGVFLIADKLRTGVTAADFDPRTVFGPQSEPPIEAAPPLAKKKLYAVRRRFDLATLFVVTAAFALVFAAIRTLGWPPVSAGMIGGCIAAVGAAQAFAPADWSPRLVSVAAGVAYWGAGAFVVAVLEWRVDIGDLTYFALFGAIAGYLSGVVAAGVFLIADRMRKRIADDWENEDEHA